MSLLDLFNQWIVERGSAAVQEKHIALFKDRLALADKKITELESEIVSLKSNLLDSQTTFNQLSKENNELKSNVQDDKKLPHISPLDESQVSILRILAATGSGIYLPLHTIMSDCSLSEQVAIYHLQELENLKLIEPDYRNNMPCWALNHNGRGYLIKHKIVS